MTADEGVPSDDSRLANDGLRMMRDGGWAKSEVKGRNAQGKTTDAEREWDGVAERGTLNAMLNLKCVRVRLAVQDGHSHPTGVVIPFVPAVAKPHEGVLAEAEESRLRDPSIHFVRSG